ncbi:hypothetical protein N9051_02080 [Akkermansiaceae bacterium]|nr:hypothetical protein [Akkermansiaceae bacterium]
MSANAPITCKVTNWFLWRALLMLVMFGGFCIYFLYDWKIGYPEKNLVVANYRAFNAAGQAWTVEENRNRWSDFVSEQKMPWGDDLSIYPESTDFEQTWPALLADKEAMDDKSDEGLWKDYSGEKGWSQEVDLDEDPKPAYKIKEQLYASIICFVLSVIALFYYLRTKKRMMKVDDDAFYSPDGARIPFDQMTTIDKRKWETKGLATITFTDESGQEAKAKVDGMVYGQFKEEEGAPAEVLFQRVLANFEGELIELVLAADDDEQDSDAEKSKEGGKEEIDEGDKSEAECSTEPSDAEDSQKD